MSKLITVAYYGGIPPKNNNLEKPQILDNFCAGVERVGDIAIRHMDISTVPCDVALIQGFVHDDGKKLPHLQLRKDAIELQKKNNKKSLIVDSNLFLYADPGNSKKYLRYSFDGVFPTSGYYFDNKIDPLRWNKISSDLNISLKDYRTNGNHILICLQRNGGWSMQGLDSIAWANEIINKIRMHSARPIIVRPHPGDKKTREKLHFTQRRVKISSSANIKDDLQNAWACVVYNSSPSVASLIEGVPVFVTDPNANRSQSCEVANLDLRKIEVPELKDRQQWIEKISMCHWNFVELYSGEAWTFFKNNL